MYITFSTAQLIKNITTISVDCCDVARESFSFQMSGPDVSKDAYRQQNYSHHSSIKLNMDASKKRERNADWCVSVARSFGNMIQYN